MASPEDPLPELAEATVRCGNRRLEAKDATKLQGENQEHRRRSRRGGRRGGSLHRKTQRAGLESKWPHD